MKTLIKLFLHNSIFVATSVFLAVISNASMMFAGNATVEVKAKTVDRKLELSFKAIPKEGLVINPDGPWKLEIKDPGSLKFDKQEFKRSEWQEALGGFTAQATANKEKSATIKYKLVAFMCTKDKSQCYRDVVEETATVKWN